MPQTFCFIAQYMILGSGSHHLLSSAISYNDSHGASLLLVPQGQVIKGWDQGILGMW